MALLVVALCAVVVIAVETAWGRAIALRTVVSRVNTSLGGRGTLRIAHLDVGFARPIVADSVSVRDASGVIVFSATRVEAASDWIAAFRHKVRISQLTVTRPFVHLEQGRDGTWNLARIFAAAATPPSGPSTLSLLIDSATVTDGRLELVQPDTGARGVKRRVFDHVQLALGPTRAMDPLRPDGEALLRRLSFALDDPPVMLRSLAGRVRFWKDSIALDLPEFRLPASHGSATGFVAWEGKGFPRIDVRATIDTLAVSDVAWISTLLPVSGRGSTRLHAYATEPRGTMAYALSDLDVRAAQSRLTGSLTAVVGGGVAIRDLALAAKPVNLALVREIFGANMPKPPWAGYVEGTVRGRGGPLSALRFDDIALTWHDARVPGATGQLQISGTLDASATPAVMHDFAIAFSAFDVRSLGAVTKTADSLHGTLEGRVVLDGPTPNFRFHDLLVRHADGDLARSLLTGEGRFATNVNSQWLEARLSLDTIMPATLLRDRTALPLRGMVHGTLAVSATGDTVTIESLLQAGAGTAHFAGTTLLDSTRTSLHGRATLTGVDPRVLIARRDIPALRLDGTADIAIDGDVASPDAHVLLALDTTSRIGGSHVRYGNVRAGLDAKGFHVDTAELSAADWELSARGRLARTGVTHDTLSVRARFAEADSLRTLLLDSTGAALLDTLHGAFSATGTLVGSLDDFSLDALLGVHGASRGPLHVRDLIGTARLARLPHAATGTVSVTANAIGSGTYETTGFHADAAISDGRTARLRLTAESGDSLGLSFAGDGVRDGDSTRVTVDSLTMTIGSRRWQLQRPVLASVTPSLVQIAPFVIHSTAGAEMHGSLRLPDTGEIAGSLTLTNLRSPELSLLPAMPEDLAFRANADAEVHGTRADATITVRATVDSIMIGRRHGPALQAEAAYANRGADVLFRAVNAGGDSLRASGRLPLDLSFRSVDQRLLDEPLRIEVKSWDFALDALEGVLPQVSGLAGKVNADITLAGNWHRLEPTGSLQIAAGAFDLPRSGFAARHLTLDADLRPDSITLRHLVFADDESGRDTISAAGTLVRRDGKWNVRATSVADNFLVMDDPRLLVAVADWRLRLSGPLKEPTLGGAVTLPRAVFVIDNERRVRPVKDAAVSEDAELRPGTPIISGLTVRLGNDVRLKSSAANVQLAGNVEIAGQVNNPYLLGEVDASRGTYRIDLNVLKRTFRVDSGTVRVAGTKDQPASLDIYASYLVRGNESDASRDVRIDAHLSGLSTAPRLELSSDLGSGVGQSEIISYLIFGSPSFQLDGQGSSTVKTATAALVPSFGGVLEGVLGTMLPFFSSLQVTTVAGSGPQSLAANPIDGLLNSFAITGGRQIGADGWLNLSGGVCRGSRLASTQSPSGWFGASVEYRPRLSIGAVASIDPGPSPCNSVGRLSRVYQVGLDVFREFRWR